MRLRCLLIVALLAALGVAGWYGLRRYRTPSIPDIPLDGIEKVMADAVTTALDDVRANPRSGYAWGNLAMVLSVNGFDETSTLRCYENAERFDPKNPAWPYLHALQLIPISPQKGIPLLQRALALAASPVEDTAIRFRLANALIEDGQLDEAAQQLKALEQIEPNGPRVSFTRGMLAMARGDPTTARKHLQFFADFPSPPRRALAVLASLADTPEAAAAHKARVALLSADEPWPDPFVAELRKHRIDRTSRYGLYYDLTSQGKDQEAADYLRGYVARSPDAEVCQVLGIGLLKLNRFEEAASYLRDSLGYDPKNVKTHLFLGTALFERGQNRCRESGGREHGLELLRQSVASFDQAIALQPDLGSAHLLRGRALKQLGRTEEGIAALRKALLLQPDSADSHLYLGMALAEAGELREGIEHLENAVQFARPNDARPSETLKAWRAKEKTPKSR
jgi:tetratricopeptide (TPR) repeat protein